MKSINRAGGRPTRLDRALERAKAGEPSSESSTPPEPQPPTPPPPPPPPEPPISPGPEPGLAPEVAPPPTATPEAAPGSEPASVPEPEPSGPTEEPDQVGIVFVHGIGAQLPCETLLSWSEPIVSAVAAWGAANPATVVQPEPDDLLVRSNIDFDGTTLSYVELAVPATVETETQPARPAQRWIMTEAWWASSVAAPPASVVLDWSTRQGVLARVARGIVDNSAGFGGSAQRFFAAFGLGSFLTLTSSLSVLTYSVVRTVAALIPIKEIRDLAVFAAFEGFLMRWWGDVYVLLRDPVQSANVRRRIADAVTALRADGCASVIILAHSGGTVASYMTLGDPTHAIQGLEPTIDDGVIRPRVTKLITHGQAINLVRALPAGTYETTADGASLDRIAAPLPWTGRWVDFWATHDPAPSGPIRLETSAPRPDFETRMVWNRRSIREDHGGYLTNEEEFVLPLLRELDTPRSSAADSRFPEPACATIDDRRQRVLTLTMWRRFAFVAPLIAFLVAIRDGLAASGIGALLEVARGVWPYVPGHAVVDTLVGWLAAQASLVAWASVLGLATLIALTLMLSLHAAFPVRRTRVWRHHPATFAVASFLDWVPAAAILLVVGLPMLLALLGTLLDGRFGTFLLLLLGASLVALAALLARRRDETLSPGVGNRTDTLIGIAVSAIVIVFFGSTLIAVIANDAIRSLVIGAAIAFLAFRPLVGYGGSRWDRWDRVERAAARHWRPRPSRAGRGGEAVGLVGIGIVLAVGLTGASLGGASLLWVALALLVAFAIVVSITDGAAVDA